MKRFLCTVLAAVTILCSVLCVPANAAYDDIMDTLVLYSECFCLISSDNGEVIFSKAADKQTSPASLTKIVTAIVVLENCEDLEQLVIVPEECIRELDGTGSSLGGLKAGEQISVYNLLCCLLIASANEAATTLANFISGSDRAAFIEKMNKVAEELGCTNSHFVNPHGLDDPDQYVSAEDIAKFLKYALNFPAFAEITSKHTYTLPETNMNKERILQNTNKMLANGIDDYYCRYVKGGKTGTTSLAGHCVATYASYDGYNYIAVAMRSTFYDVDNDGVEENGAFLDVKKALEWTYSNIELASIADPTQIVAEFPVKYAKNVDFVTASPAEITYCLVPKGTNSGSVLIEPISSTVPEVLKAPIKKGEKICDANIYYSGKKLKQIELVASSDVETSIFSLIGAFANELLSSWLFRIAAIIILAAFGFLLYTAVKRSKNKKIKSREYKIINYNDIVQNNKKK